VYHGNYWLAVPLVLVSSHLMHGMLVGFHEASHGLLRKNRLFNEIDGLIIGVLSLMSFSLYRAAHQLHHAHLATQRDEELWPFTDPAISRGARFSAAVAELTLGIFFTPFLFLRTFLREGSPIRNAKLRRRIWREYAAIAVVWMGIFTAVASLHLWTYFLWLHVFPAVLAANMQSVRKYIEHVGLTGSTINSSTRSIVANNWLGRLVSFTLLHEPFHGVHHRFSGLPHAELPGRVSELEPKTPEERPPFRSYGHAFVDLWRNLADPRVGAHWHEAPAATAEEVAETGRTA
jgi:fatty acid desaturase